MSPVAKRGPPTSVHSLLNWRFSLASHRAADGYPLQPRSIERPQAPRTHSLADLWAFKGDLCTHVVALLAAQFLAGFLSGGAPTNVLRNVLQLRNYETIASIANDV